MTEKTRVKPNGKDEPGVKDRCGRSARRDAICGGWAGLALGVVTGETRWSACSVPGTYEERSEQVRNAILRGLADGQDVEELYAELARSDDRRQPHPARAVLDLAVAALGLASTHPSQPVVYEGLRETYLPEVVFEAGRSTATASTCSTPRLRCTAGWSRTWPAIPAGGAHRRGRTPTTRS